MKLVSAHVSHVTGSVLEKVISLVKMALDIGQILNVMELLLKTEESQKWPLLSKTI
jgi:hypothetical protein